jgi:hypothetical protein
MVKSLCRYTLSIEAYLRSNYLSILRKLSYGKENLARKKNGHLATAFMSNSCELMGILNYQVKSPSN